MENSNQNLELLYQTKNQLITNLAEITANPKLNYSLDGQSLSWLEYQKFLFDQIFVVEKLIQIQGNPMELATQAWSW